MIRAALAAAAVVGVGVIVLCPPRIEAQVLIMSMTVLAIMFVVSYAIRSPWRATQAGRSMMATTVALAAIGAQQSSVWLFGDYAWRNEVRAVVLLALALTLLHRLLVLWRIQHEEEVP
ncbi:MAG: hypothetical protein WAX14_12335 [Rhodococcus sp. (in: high G+C Gram-positive bacteria)]|uniref:putative phage holin n=1 Tax=Rhodococcus sp. TaxID=1831 RepID=UPI003BB74A6E